MHESQSQDGRQPADPETDTLTLEGVRVAVFYSKIHSRLLRPLVAASDQPPRPLAAAA